MLTGEYAILDGAIGLGLPTTYGQHLSIEENSSGILHWTSLDHSSNSWFEASYSLNPFSLIEASSSEISDRLIQILTEVKRLNPAFLSETKGYNVEAKLTFQKDWGLGSSSTLVNNIANWSGVNPYTLLKATFGGSGYDIACASNNLPIMYKTSESLPIVKEVGFKPTFADQLYFIYLNEKRNSRDAIKHYSNLKLDKQELTNNISEITQKIVISETLKEFEELLILHEKLISRAIGIAPIQERLFSDFIGVVKSLGAWGGDFVLAIGNEETPNYFKEKGYQTIIPYTKMIL